MTSHGHQHAQTHSFSLFFSPSSFPFRKYFSQLFQGTKLSKSRRPSLSHCRVTLSPEWPARLMVRVIACIWTNSTEQTGKPPGPDDAVDEGDFTWGLKRINQVQSTLKAKGWKSDFHGRRETAPSSENGEWWEFILGWAIYCEATRLPKASCYPKAIRWLRHSSYWKSSPRSLESSARWLCAVHESKRLVTLFPWAFGREAIQITEESVFLDTCHLESELTFRLLWLTISIIISIISISIACLKIKKQKPTKQKAAF